MKFSQLNRIILFVLLVISPFFPACQSGEEYEVNEEITQDILEDQEGLFTSLWEGTKLAGTEQSEIAAGVCADSSDDSFNVYVAGSTSGAFDNAVNEGKEDIFAIKYDFSGEKLWESQFGSASSDIATAVLSGGLLGIYVAGYTHGDLDENINQGGKDLFLMRFAPGGEVSWVRQLGSDQDETVAAMAVDNAGNVYLTGYTRGSLGKADSGGGGGQSASQSDVSADMLLLKYNSAGAKVFIEQFDASAFEDQGLAIAVDGAGNIFVAGCTDDYIGDSFSDPTGDSTGDVKSHANKGKSDIFLVKYNSSVVIQWTRQFGTVGDDIPSALAMDSSGAIYLAGWSEGRLDASGDASSDANAGGTNAFIVKFDASGDIQWTRHLGTNGDDIATGLDLDSSGAVYVSGQTLSRIDSSCDAALGDIDVFLIKYDRTGTKQWCRQFGTTAADGFADVSIDGNDNAYVSAFTFGTPDNTDNQGNADVLLIKFNSSGEKQ